MTTAPSTVNISSLPQYLQHLFLNVLPLTLSSTSQYSIGTKHQAESNTPPNLAPLINQPYERDDTETQVQILDLFQIRSDTIIITTKHQKYAHLLLYRHHLTTSLLPDSLSPDLILSRALTYEALGYDDLALADAYVSLTLWDSLVDESGSDLRPDFGDDEDLDEERVRKGKYDSLLVLVRCSARLGSWERAKGWIESLVGILRENGNVADDATVKSKINGDLEDHFVLYDDDESKNGLRSDFIAQLSSGTVDNGAHVSGHFGWCRREIYPWNEHEPDRLKDEVLEEINGNLKVVAPLLEVRKARLPKLGNSSVSMSDGEKVTEDEDAFQLGLYALKNLSPNTIVLQERSALTAIRAHGDALCDACAADLEEIPLPDRRKCAACDIAFCSDECHSLATAKYHQPNTDDEETEDGFPPAHAPFCPGLTGINDISTLGRAESSLTPEWDLYFLLLSRCLQMAETQDIHPLDLFETKFLWGDFLPSPESKPRYTLPRRTLPYSISHHVELPLQFFEYIMHSLPSTTTPYSAAWLDRYDWWIIQTLFAKFRGVADAQQSVWTGKPEIAAVHPLWCLANHSCAPNVTWRGAGVRNLTVVSGEEMVAMDEDGNDGDEWVGIKKGEQVWNHYTDVNEPDYRARRERLLDVLGGECRCGRCLREEKEK